MIANYSDQEVIKGKKAIFLAGPTPRNDKTISWRIQACKILEEYGFDGVVYNPEYSNHKAKDDYVEQSMWEREALSNASVIVFWVPRYLPENPAFTTNVEFGYWIHTGKIIYGRPDDASKIKYLDWLYKTDTDKEPINNLETLLKEAVELADEIGVNKACTIIPLEDRKIMK